MRQLRMSRENTTFGQKKLAPLGPNAQPRNDEAKSHPQPVPLRPLKPYANEA